MTLRRTLTGKREMGRTMVGDGKASDADVAHASNFDTEKALAGRGYCKQNAVYKANQHLVQEGIARKGNTRLVKFVDVGDQRTDDLVARLKVNDTPAVISMSESWTDEALRYLRRERHPDPSVKLAALNYASCSYIGGSYSNGDMTRAQEEELCRLFPALFESMKTCPEAGFCEDGDMTYYQNHVFGARFEDGYTQAKNVLFTEEVQCLRGGVDMSYSLLHQDANRVSSGFVEAAAPLFARCDASAFADWIAKPEETYEKTFLTVFWAPKSVDPSYDVIVVGPWGCGAFGNDPQVVAQSFVNVIRNHDLLHRYREIHFCLGRSPPVDETVGGACSSNVDVFRQVLKDYSAELVDYTTHLQAKVAQWLMEELAM